MSDPVPGTRLVERALALFETLVAADPRVAEERRFARSEYFGPGHGATADPAAEQRFREWFLFEHGSDALGGLPARLLLERWVAAADEDLAPMAVHVLGSTASVFEVSGLVDSGVWAADLAGSGEYPLAEPEAAGELAVGDLLVGRIYPVGDGLFRASPAAVCIRDAELSRALRADFERARATRRGTPRLSQALLEQTFFQGTAEAARAAEDPDAVLERARAWLSARGLAPEQIDATFDVLREEPYRDERLVPGAGDAVARVLEVLAFETEVDLSAARRHLLDVWSALWRQPPGGPGPAPAPIRRANPPPATAADDVSRALEDFDRARAAGGDLEVLFDRLERDLGLAPETGPDDESAPDFPGVVGAMVEEFVWEESREGARGVPASHENALRGLADCARNVGVFEELSEHDLRVFTTCYLVERGNLETRSDASDALDAVERFCLWARDNHDVGVWNDFAGTLASLRESLPRLVTANRNLAADDGGRARGPERVHVYEVRSAGATTVLTRGSEDSEVALDPDVYEHLQGGDLVRATRRDGALRLLGCYPPESRPILLV